MIERARQLLIDKPNMTYKTFYQLTHLKKWVYERLKNEISYSEKIENFSLREKVKKKLKREMSERMKSYGFLNLKATPLEKL